MIDIATFYKMHPEKVPNIRLEDHLEIEASACEQPPSGDFLLLLPAVIQGFNMREKKWGKLRPKLQKYDKC